MLTVGKWKNEESKTEHEALYSGDKLVYVGWNVEKAKAVFETVGRDGPMSIDEYVEALVPPQGFTKTVSKEKGFGRNPLLITTVAIVGEDVRVKFCMDSEEIDCHVRGTTDYRADGKWFTFDRQGLDMSFYDWFRCEPMRHLNEQIDRAKKRIDSQKNDPVTTVPGTTISMSVSHRAKVVETLKQGGSATITPAGFGTGYRLSTKRGKWSCPAEPKMKKFFGVEQLFVERIDCD